MTASTESLDGKRELARAPGGALAEFERLRKKLGFCTEPTRLLDERYRVERTLGRGAMGEVHLAYDHRLERRVALKLVRGGSAHNPHQLRARLEREALALARVDHPNVIGIHDVGSHAGETYFTMQYVAGTTLRAWQNDPGRTSAELIDAYLQAARGLAAAHACGVMHRDFKPDNVIVGEDGQVRVLDFGIAAALRSDQAGSAGSGAALEGASTLAEQGRGTSLDSVGSVGSASTLMGSSSASLTRTGTLLGTLPYMSPEQLRGVGADAGSDQFGFCVALWEALTEARPFVGPGVATLLESIEGGPMRVDLLPGWLQPILSRGLAVEPARRWPSMNELIQAIERGRSRGRKLMLGFGLALSLAVAAVTGWSIAPEPTLPPVEPCGDFVNEIDAIWTPARREALEARASLDPGAIDYAITTIEELASDWKTAAAAQCDAEVAPAPDAPARVCASAWLERLEDHLELLVERGDAKTLSGAPDLLARLVPANGDYCGLRLSQPVDPEVWRLAERARASVPLGDIEQAFELADAALDRATQLHADEPARAFTADAAVAHAARAEVAAFGGRSELAFEALALTERHAIGSGSSELLLPTWVLWAKLLALSGGASEDALALVGRAEPLVFALDLQEQDPRRAELFEAQGLGERSRGHHDEAIALHRQAQSIFVAAGQPTLAVKSLINIGANLQELEQPEQARSVYEEAVELLDRAGLPPSYRNRILLEYNLGALDYAAERAEGLEHFGFVVEHGNDAERLEALAVIVALALNLKDEANIKAWSQRALDELAAQPQAELGVVVLIQQTVGIGLANHDDSRGEALLHTAERNAEGLPLQVQFNLQRDWVLMLERAGRCEQARVRRQAVVTRLDQEPAPPADYQAWRDDGAKASCVSSKHLEPRAG